MGKIKAADSNTKGGRLSCKLGAVNFRSFILFYEKRNGKKPKTKNVKSTSISISLSQTLSLCGAKTVVGSLLFKKRISFVCLIESSLLYSTCPGKLIYHDILHICDSSDALNPPLPVG